MTLLNTPTNTPLKLHSKFILFIAMLYIAISTAADVVSFKFVNFFGLMESGANILFPLTYVLCDVTTEVYGWSVSMRIIWLGLLCEIIFVALVMLVIHIPSYGIGEYQDEYVHVLGNIWAFLSGAFIATATASLLNVYFISKWKIAVKGKLFWLRSIMSTCISELVMIGLTVFISFLPFFNIEIATHLLIDIYILEMIYAIIFVIPAQFLAKWLTKLEGIDAYDYGVSYNPFKFI